nr:MAG TPA: hypothetical protein [Bacteriophage sp.]
MGRRAPFGGASLEILFIIYIYNFIYNGWRGMRSRGIILSVGKGWAGKL